MILEDVQIPDHPEIVVFAAYSGPPKYPMRVSLLGEMVSGIISLDIIIIL